MSSGGTNTVPRRLPLSQRSSGWLLHQSGALLYGRRPGQPSSSSLARRACVHIDFVFWDFLNFGCAPGPFGGRGDTPRWGLMAGTAACCTQFFSCCPFSFPVQPQSTELPATTEGRWRRRHLSPGHKAGLLTVLLTCTGCAFQVTPGLEKGVTLKRATNPRTGGYHPKNWTLDSDTLAVPFFSTSFMVSSCFSAHSCVFSVSRHKLSLLGTTNLHFDWTSPVSFLAPHGVHLLRKAARKALVSHGATGS